MDLRATILIIDKPLCYHDFIVVTIGITKSELILQ
jgi:hypothetical protein